MANKKLTKKEKQQLKDLKKNIILSTILFILVIIFTYFIFKTDILKPKLNEMTASYISFNNSNTTDMLKISDLDEMTDNKGKSRANKNALSFKVSGNKNSPYEIVVYSVNKKDNLKNIKFSLTEDEKILALDNLSKKDLSQDGGIIIYKGKIKKDNNLILRMWTSKKDNNSKNLSFEIKVKSR